jgi:hypothetical protein
MQYLKTLRILFSLDLMLEERNKRMTICNILDPRLCIRMKQQLSWRFILIETYLAPYSRVLLVKLIVTQLVKKLPAFYWTRRFINIFKEVRQIRKLRVTHRNMLVFLRWGVGSSPHNHQAGGPHLVGCLRIIIKCTCSSTQYLEVIPLSIGLFLIHILK